MTKREEIEDKITALFCGPEKELALDVLNDMFDPSDLFNEEHMDHVREWARTGYVREDAVKDAVKVKELEWGHKTQYEWDSELCGVRYEIEENSVFLGDFHIFTAWNKTGMPCRIVETDSLAAAKNACQRDFNEYIKSALEG